MPITSRKVIRPFEIDLDSRTKKQDTVLAFQVRVVDLIDRQAVFLEHAPDDILERCCEALVQCVE